MTDGQVELWRFVVVQPPDTFPRLQRESRECFDFLECYLRGDSGDGGFRHGGPLFSDAAAHSVAVGHVDIVSSQLATG